MLNNCKQTNSNADLNFHSKQNIKIGIFDSGIGGLIVAKAIQTALPREALIYIGDTAHCPWGDQSKQQVTNYVTKITEFLINNNCNILVAACNTASSIAMDQINNLLKTKGLINLKLFNVIDPTVVYLNTLDLTNYNAIGIIGTKQTIYSQSYQNKILNSCYKDLPDPKPPIMTLATPILVPLIEEGLIDHPATKLIVTKYLAELNLPDQSILILGCTHYPLIKQLIEDYYKDLQQDLTILDPTNLIVHQIQTAIKQQALVQPTIIEKHQDPQKQTIPHLFYFTAESQFFNDLTNKFFKHVNLELLPLWS